MKTILAAISLVLILFTAQVSIAEPININQADAKTIAKNLKGIGEKKAEAIVAYRDLHGPFKNHKALTAVKGIGAKTVEKNRDDILFEPASNKQSK